MMPISKHSQSLAPRFRIHYEKTPINKTSFDSQRCVELLDKIRRDKPRVHCITNTVAMNLTANTLLAVGAIPSMSIDPGEISDFVANANALLINLGTLSSDRFQCIPTAIEIANAHQTLWILDPVFVHRSTKRLAFAQQLLNQKPAVIRANLDEIHAMIGEDNDVNEFALSKQTVVAQTGQPDMVTDGNHQTRIFNGHELMTRVTGLGCATSALVAAFAAVTDNVFEAAAGALVVMGIVGEVAAERASGPGSLQCEIVDCLYNLGDGEITQWNRIE